MNRLPRLRTLLATAAIAVAPLLPLKDAEAALIDLAFLLDRSGSVGSSNWNNIITPGLADALDAALLPVVNDPTPQNDYRVTVVTFASNATTIVTPTIVDNTNLMTVTDAIRNAPYSGGLTNLAAGTDLVRTELDPLMDADRGILNLTSDGNPTAGGFCDGFVFLGVCIGQNFTDEQAALLRADQLLANTGITAISAEAIGNIDLGFLNQYTRPNTVSAPPFPGDPFSQGFVVAVPTFQDYAPAIAAKVDRIVNPVPEPMTIAMLGVGLLGIGFAARRRAAA